MRRYENPHHHAYHDGTRYHCIKIECFAENAKLREIDRITTGKPLIYIPVLQCSECKATYFGLLTRDLEAVEVIKKYHEQREKAEEERKQNAITLATMDAEAFYAEEKRREQEQREEVIRHEEEENGDIILPNILTV